MTSRFRGLPRPLLTFDGSRLLGRQTSMIDPVAAMEAMAPSAVAARMMFGANKAPTSTSQQPPIEERNSSGDSSPGGRARKAAAMAKERDSYPMAGDVKTNWTDLFFWAVLADERPIAMEVWQRTSEPMRFAIWAAHLAESISNQQVTTSPSIPPLVTRGKPLLTIPPLVTRGKPLLTVLPALDATWQINATKRKLWQDAAGEYESWALKVCDLP